MIVQQIPTSEEWNGINDTVYLTNFSANQIVFKSDKVPPKMKFIVNDMGFIFTTAGGSVILARYLNDGSIKRLTGAISASTSGVSGIVLNEGERFAIILGSTGVGVVDIYTDGILKEKTITKMNFFKPVEVDLRGRGGF